MRFDKKYTTRWLSFLFLVGLLAYTISGAYGAPFGNAAINTNVDDKFGTTESETSNTQLSSDDTETVPTGSDDDLVYLNATDVEIKDLIKQISKSTGTNFLIEDKIRGKITIISEKPMTKEMAYQAFLSALEVMGYTTVKTPGGLLKIVQTKQAIQEPIDLFTYNSPNTDRFITRILSLKNISANDISTVVKSLVSKEGNLFAYPQTNSLIITDKGSNIDRIMKIIKELDQEGPQEIIEIVPVYNADAKDITEKITQLFEQQFESKTTNRRTTRRRSGSPELEEAPSISKVIADDRTNAVIILGSKRAIVKVRALIARLDTAVDGAEGTIHVYYLKHASAKEMASVLSSLVSNSSSSKTKTTAAQTKNAKPAANASSSSTGAVQLTGGVKVTADEGTNSLVITASPKDYQVLLDQVVRKLDIPRRQVYLEAVIMELTVEKARSLGVSGNFGRLFNLGGESLSAFGALLPSFQSSISSIVGAAGGLAGGGFSERTIDITTSDGSTVSIPAVSAMIQAMQTDSDVNVLSTPSILTLDNEEAKIQIGQEIPVPSGSTVTNVGQNFSITREDTGIIMTVTPQISESDTVRLKISQEISSIGAQDPTLGATFTKRTVDTVVVANDKQTIVIGGLIDDQQRVTTAKVPLLGDVPLVGNLFKNRQNQKTKKNIIVFITPYIIHDRDDYLDILRKKIEERNLFIDLNYGYGQRKQIRESIRNHAKELLEFRGYLGQVEVPNPPTTFLDPSTPQVVVPTATPNVQENHKYGRKYNTYTKAEPQYSQPQPETPNPKTVVPKVVQ